jgi:S-(hydroxymethyl)glutathione dehydrogenase/alcohol dehydrogenase
MRAAVQHQIGQDKLEVFDDVEAVGFGPGKVRVRIRATGLCHSDLSAMSGVLPQPAPFIPGHEGAGEIAEVGEGVDGLAVGDRVLVCWLPACGACPACKRGQSHLCLAGFLNAGTANYRRPGGDIFGFAGTGTFAEEVVLSAPCAVPIPDDVPFEIAALIGCGVTTGIGAALNTAKVEAGSSVAVIGCGGVGLAVIQGARLAGAARIVAIDVLPEKLALAAELGATDTVDGSSGESVAQVRELTDGVDYAFSAITSPAGLVDAVRMCAYAGTATLVGVPPPGRTLDIDLELDLFHPKVAIAVTHGGDTIPQEDFPFLARAALDGKLDLDRFVTKTISLDEVPEALDDLHTQKGVRTVVRL